jgi:hypothetical protein
MWAGTRSQPAILGLPCGRAAPLAASWLACRRSRFGKAPTLVPQTYLVTTLLPPLSQVLSLEDDDAAAPLGGGGAAAEAARRAAARLGAALALRSLAPALGAAEVSRALDFLMGRWVCVCLFMCCVCGCCVGRVQLRCAGVGWGGEYGGCTLVWFGPALLGSALCWALFGRRPPIGARGRVRAECARRSALAGPRPMDCSTSVNTRRWPASAAMTLFWGGRGRSGTPGRPRLEAGLRRVPRARKAPVAGPPAQRRRFLCVCVCVWVGGHACVRACVRACVVLLRAAPMRAPLPSRPILRAEPRPRANPPPNPQPPTCAPPPHTHNSGLGDPDPAVREAMVAAGSAVVDLHGAAHAARLLPLFENYLAHRPAGGGDEARVAVC